MTYAEKKAWVRENIILFATLLFPGARIVHAHAMISRCKAKAWTKIYSWRRNQADPPVCEECAARGVAACHVCLFVWDEIWPNLGEAGRISFWEFLAFRAEPAAVPTPPTGEARPPDQWE